MLFSDSIEKVNSNSSVKNILAQWSKQISTFLDFWEMMDFIKIDNNCIFQRWDFMGLLAP